MKRLNMLALLPTIGALLFFTVETCAQEAPKIELSATPTQLTISGKRGESATRQVMLKSNLPVSDLKIIPLELTRADGQLVISATAIRPAPSQGNIDQSGLLEVLFTFDLKGAPSGEFAGQIWIQHQAGRLVLPVTVKVKDHWPWPLALLLLGIILGIVVSRYRDAGRPRDEVLVRAGQLRAEMRAEPELAQAFKVKIEALLLDVSAALQNEKWDDAKKSIEQAEAVMLKWRKGRADWQEQFKYQQELIRRAKDMEWESSNYLLMVIRKLEDTTRKAPDLEGPDKLRDALDKIKEQLNHYVVLKSLLDDLDNFWKRLPPEKQEPWRLKSLAWKQRMDNLSPDDQAAYETLREEIEAGIEELKKLISEHLKATGAKSPAGFASTLISLLLPPPSASALDTAATAEDAKTRLRIFMLTSYALAVALLAGAAFGELYVSKQTFGANPWSDYFTLLAAGFGAEATRAAVAAMLRSWGLPGVR